MAEAPRFRQKVPRKVQAANTNARWQWTRALAAAFATLCLPFGAGQFSAAQAAAVSLNPSADTALLENFPTNNLGAQAWLNTGTTQVYTRNRALLKFDVAGAVPGGARITGVSLTLHVTKSPVDGDLPSTFDLHRMLVDWGEGSKSGDPPLLGAEATVGEASWTHRFALTTNAWATPGGAAGVDFEGASSADTYVYGVTFSPYTFDLATNMIADVQRWLDHPDQNFGWMLKTRNESENFSARRFASREDEFLPPLLVVEYSVIQFERVTKSGERIILEFLADAGRSYSVEYRDRLEESDWHGLTNVAAQAETGRVHIEDSIVRDLRFYRLRSE